jgi:PmbA protein
MFDDMVKSVEKGVLLSRFSGGSPADNGDFSGVAKNSYLIEKGKIAYPITEAMISGNMADLLMDITNVSAERTDFGFAVLPYVAASGITVSGK